MLNCAAIMGRVVADPELRHTDSDISVTNFSLAVQRNYETGGERAVDFLDCVAWQSTAEFICKYFHKGQLVAVNGSIQTRTYTGSDKMKHKVVEILVTNAHFAGAKEEKQPDGNASNHAEESDLEEMLRDII